LPHWIDFYEEHKDDRFELIAFHDESAKSLEMLDAELAERNIIEERWGGRDLPFPVLLDHTGATMKQWEIRGFPTAFAVDPNGVLLGEMSLTEFAKLLKIDYEWKPR
jgi:hypothetical protein